MQVQMTNPCGRARPFLSTAAYGQGSRQQRDGACVYSMTQSLGQVNCAARPTYLRMTNQDVGESGLSGAHVEGWESMQSRHSLTQNAVSATYELPTRNKLACSAPEGTHGWPVSSVGHMDRSIGRLILFVTCGGCYHARSLPCFNSFVRPLALRGRFGTMPRLS